MMEINEPEFNSPEAAIPPVIELIRTEMEEYDSVAAYTRSLIEAYAKDENYHANLLQLQRIAGLVVSPELGMGSQSAINGFYWGETLGMAVGDRIFDEAWANILYETINLHFLEARRGSEDEQAYSVLQPDERPSLPDTSRQKVETADLLLALMEDEQYDLPKSYQDMITEWAPQLSKDELGQYYITAGFNFLVNITLSQAQYELNVVREEQVGRAVDAAVNWEKVERKAKSNSFGLLPPES